MYAHTQTFHSKDHGRSIVQPKLPTSMSKLIFTLISRLGFDSRTLAHMLDSLVRVSRRVDEKHFVRVTPRIGRICLGQPSPSPSKQASPACRRQVYNQHTASQRFLFSNFTYYFTLFSKCFSSFPHGTCLLSVSYPYLALDGIYHPL